MHFQNNIEYISEEETTLPDLDHDWDTCTSEKCKRLGSTGHRHKFYMEDESPNLSHGNIVQGDWDTIQLGDAGIEEESYPKTVDKILDFHGIHKVRKFLASIVVLHMRFWSLQTSTFPWMYIKSKAGTLRRINAKSYLAIVNYL